MFVEESEFLLVVYLRRKRRFVENYCSKEGLERTSFLNSRVSLSLPRRPFEQRQKRIHSFRILFVLSTTWRIHLLRSQRIFIVVNLSTFEYFIFHSEEEEEEEDCHLPAFFVSHDWGVRLLFRKGKRVRRAHLLRGVGDNLSSRRRCFLWS